MSAPSFTRVFGIIGNSLPTFTSMLPFASWNGLAGDGSKNAERNVGLEIAIL